MDTRNTQLRESVVIKCFCDHFLEMKKQLKSSLAFTKELPVPEFPMDLEELLTGCFPS